MKMLLGVVFALSFSTAFASPEVKPLKIKEIKSHLKTINPETTCMDEYLQRRKQLITKLALSPATIVVGTAASLYGGAFVGAGVAHVAGATGGWDGLGYVLGGMMLGTTVGVVSTGVDTAATSVTLHNINLIIKTLGEHHLDRDLNKSNVLYAKYLKKSGSNISQDDFLARLVKADEDGSLCDGSMVKQPKIRLGSKLKYKVAKLKDIAKNL